MENQENNLEEEELKCDPSTKPASSPIPAGMSNQSYIRCVYPNWEWYDPAVA